MEDMNKLLDFAGPSPLFQNNGIAYFYLDGGLGQQAWEVILILHHLLSRNPHDPRIAKNVAFM